MTQDSPAARDHGYSWLSAALTVRSLLAAAIVLFVHLLVICLGPWLGDRGLLSNLAMLGACVLGAIACYSASRRSRRFAHQFWLLAFGWLSLWIVGQLIWIYYENVLHHPLRRPWPSDIVFFIALIPVATTVLLDADTDSDTSDWDVFLDFVQIGIVTAAAYLFFLYVPTFWSGQTQRLNMTMEHVWFIRSILVALVVLLRAVFSPSKLEKMLFGVMAAILFVLTALSALGAHAIIAWNLPSGSWIDIVWTLPFLLVAVAASSWQDAYPAPVRNQMRSKLATVFTSVFAPLFMPGIVLLLGAKIAAAQISVAFIAIMASFSCFSIRFLITQSRRQRTRELQHAKNMAEASNQLKSQFLANMSHEIRTPLNGVIGMIEMASLANPTPEQKELLHLAQESANSLLTVINDILDFSKIEAGKLELDPAEFELAETVAEAVRTLALRAHQKGLELAYSVASDIPRFLMGDALRLKQVLINLVSNSIKFTSQGEVLLRISRERLEADLVTLKFSVVDSGIGIPKDKQDLIFQAFSQADPSTTRKFGGTGLGLTISARIVSLMGGEMWVESEVGRGSTFSFTASLKIADSNNQLIDPYRATLRDARVLIVDDNLTSRRSVEETLSGWQMLPVAAESGAAAIDFIERSVANRTPFSVVLVDSRMPGMDGFEFVRQMRLVGQPSPAVTMMLTADDYNATVARCKEMGIASRLIKPIKQSELLAALHQSLPSGAEAASTMADAPAEDSVAPSKLNILLAEDNLVNQKLAVRILERAGHLVEVAGNGREALARLDKRAFDLVLMDVQMPHMDGLETAAAIRAKEQREGGHVPIIAMTAHAMKGDREKCLTAGMDDYISKPINAAELHKIITRTINATSRNARVGVAATT